MHKDLLKLISQWIQLKMRQTLFVQGTTFYSLEYLKLGHLTGREWLIYLLQFSNYFEKGVIFVIEFIEEFWIEWLLGLIVAALGFATKKFYSLWQEEKKRKRSDEQKRFEDDIKAAIKESSSESRKEEEQLQRQIDIIKSGVLSLQGRIFRQECRDFLESEKEFSLDDFEELQAEYDTYKQLGGNHMGDILFSMVQEKGEKSLTNNAEEK